MSTFISTLIELLSCVNFIMRKCTFCTSARSGEERGEEGVEVGGGWLCLREVKSEVSIF